MLSIRYHNSFKKDYKRIVKRGYNIRGLEILLETLVTNKPLPVRYKDHSLIGNYKNYRECHITPDWLLVYQKKNESELVLHLLRTGTQSDLF